MTGDKKRILVIDDNFAAVQLIKIRLERAGYEVVTLYSAVEGLRQVKTINPDLITMDIMMPDMNGIQALEKFKADPETSDIPIILVSTVDEEEQKERSYLMGAADYVMKPIEVETLISSIKKNIGGEDD
ncbi:MAG: response regulator [Elusimicrobia bacterium]|nr:response regulator [Elusimicrobiota bacterium]